MTTLGEFSGKNYNYYFQGSWKCLTCFSVDKGNSKYQIFSKCMEQVEFKFLFQFDPYCFSLKSQNQIFASKHTWIGPFDKYS